MWAIAVSILFLIGITPLASAAEVSILFLIGITPLASAADFPVVDGERQATIVFSTDAKKITQSHWIVTASDPYTELAACIEKVTGRRLVTVREDDFQPAEGKFPIYVGNCRITQELLGGELGKLDRDGFMIVVEPERVFLAGPRVWSSYWAVCQFLEDYVGVRWLIPGPLGEDIPRQERIVVPVCRRVEEPVLLGRRWSGVDDRSGAEWSLRQRVTPTSRYNRYKFSHNLGKIFRPEKYFDEHPEYFPMRDGQRFRPATGSHSNWQPCMTEPGTVQVAAQAAREAFDQDPDLEAYSFGINDNAGFCECRPLWQTHGELPGIPDGRSQGSTLFYSWLTKVAQELEKTHPDKLLGCLAYANNTTPPPKEVEITRRILPYITFTIADLYVPEYRDIVGNLVEAWGDRVNQIGFYDYAYGVGFVLPRIYTHLLQDTLQHGLEHNLKGVYAEVYPNWGLDAPRIYLTAALWWNPYVDIDALFDEWNERMFREAAAPMKKYFARCEQAWMNYEGFWDRGESKSKFDIFMRTPILEVYTPEVLEECTGYLDEAAQLAESDLVKQRLHFFRKTWDLGLVFAKAYWPNQTIRRLIAQDAPVEQVAQALHKIPEAMKLADFKREVKERVGDDRLAFNPRVKDHWLPIPGRSSRSWIQDYKTDAADKTYHWFVARLTPPAIERARRAGMLRARTVRQMVAKHIREVFPTGGSSRYQEAVADISMMALKVVNVAPAKSIPRIDGILDDGIWSQAGELSDFAIRGSSMVPSECATTGRIAHDGENLYVAVECRRQVKGSGVPDIVGDLSWPEQWHVFGPLGRDDPVLPGEVLRTIPDEIEVAGRKLTAQPVTATENKFDFAPLLGGTKVGRTGYAFLAALRWDVQAMPSWSWRLRKPGR